MILTGSEIEQQVSSESVVISPFDPARLSTNTYDLTLGTSLIRYTDAVLDPRVEPAFETFDIPEEGHLMQAGDFLLGASAEVIGSNDFVPIIHAKSGTARMGLFVHVTADLIDIGWTGTSTFQLYATLPVRIYAGMRIAQVSFWVPKGEITLYSGKYQNTTGPQPSKLYLDYALPQAGKMRSTQS